MQSQAWVKEQEKPPEFPLVPKPFSLRLDTWEKSKDLQSGNIKKSGTLLRRRKSRTCSVGICKAGRQTFQGGSEVEAHLRGRKAPRMWGLEAAVVVPPGALVLKRWVHRHGWQMDWAWAAFPFLLPSWVTWGDLFNLSEHQPPHIANEDNHICLAGLSGDSMTASVWHA